MARNFNITSANAKVILSCALFPAGLQFENFSVDTMWTQDLVQQLEARMSADGKLSFGYTPNPKPISFQFQPNSATVDSLDYLVQTQDLSQAPVVCQMVIELKSLGKAITLQNGACVSNKLLPNGVKVLDPMQYDFSFEAANVVPL